MKTTERPIIFDVFDRGSPTSPFRKVFDRPRLGQVQAACLEEVKKKPGMTAHLPVTVYGYVFRPAQS